MATQSIQSCCIRQRYMQLISRSSSSCCCTSWPRDLVADCRSQNTLELSVNSGRGLLSSLACEGYPQCSRIGWLIPRASFSFRFTICRQKSSHSFHSISSRMKIATCGQLTGLEQHAWAQHTQKFSQFNCCFPIDQDYPYPFIRLKPGSIAHRLLMLCCVWSTDGHSAMCKLIERMIDAHRQNQSARHMVLLVLAVSILVHCSAVIWFKPESDEFQGSDENVQALAVWHRGLEMRLTVVKWCCKSIWLCKSCCLRLRFLAMDHNNRAPRETNPPVTNRFAVLPLLTSFKVWRAACMNLWRKPTGIK